MSYLWAGNEPAVRWVAGVAPGQPGPDGAVQLGLSGEVARTLGRQRRRHVHGRQARPLDLSRSWSRVCSTRWTCETRYGRRRRRSCGRRRQGRASRPRPWWEGCCPRLRCRRPALLSSRTASRARSTSRWTRRRWTTSSSGTIVTQLAALEAAPASLTGSGPAPRVTSQLSSLVPQARDRVAATWSQANVVLAGLACAAVLVILVVRRSARAPTVGGAAHRACPWRDARRHRRASRCRISRESSAWAPLWV